MHIIDFHSDVFYAHKKHKKHKKHKTSNKWFSSSQMFFMHMKKHKKAHKKHKNAYRRTSDFLPLDVFFKPV